MTREEARERMKVIKDDCYIIDNPEDKEAFDMAISALQDRPQGHWEYTQEARGTCGFIDKYHICSVCGTRALAEGSSDLADECLSDYCPKCGAKMDS